MLNSSVWDPPAGWLRITTIDAHTAGEPLRVITSGYPELPGDNILTKRSFAKEHLDQLRKALMWEPRGHADMYGCIVTDPETPDGTIGVIFMHNEGYSTMCGHGIIGLTKVALDTGMLHIEGEQPVIHMDTPAGRVKAVAHRVFDSVHEVTFNNVPSFVYASDQSIQVPGVGKINYDIAFGGAFYAFVDWKETGVGLSSENAAELIDVGMRIKNTVMENCHIEHPFLDDLSFLYGTIFLGPPENPENHSRNVCIFADGELDRCPTGTGVSARAAIHYARGEMEIGQPFTVESIIGTCFTGRVEETTSYGSYPAVIPSVRGSAFIIGRNEWLIDPNDPLGHGFLIRS